MNFQSHQQHSILGQYKLTVSNRIMICDVCGPWNLSAVESYRKDTADIIESLAGAPWVVLAIVSGEPLHTFESINSLIDMLQRHREQGRNGTALLFEGELASARVYHIMIEKIYIQSNEPYLIANSREAALEWLEKQLASPIRKL